MDIDIGSYFNFGIEKFKNNMTFYIVAQVLSFRWGYCDLPTTNYNKFVLPFHFLSYPNQS